MVSRCFELGVIADSIAKMKFSRGPHEKIMQIMA